MPTQVQQIIGLALLAVVMYIRLKRGGCCGSGQSQHTSPSQSSSCHRPDAPEQINDKNEGGV